METNEAARLEEELFIDPDTGEITATDHELSVAVLPKMARSLRAIERQMEMVAEFRKDELSRISESCDHKINKLRERAATLTSLAQTIAKSTGEKKLEYPGIGYFRFGTTREAVDDSDYQAMPDDEKAKLHNNYQGCFRSKTVTTPDKKWIKGSIEQGQPVPGFVIKDKEETFTFHKED